MNSTATATIKLPGRLKSGKGIQIGVRCPLAVLDEIDRWAATQPDKPKRADAILRLVQEALADTTDKQLKMPPGSLSDSPNAEGASLTAPTAPQPPPQDETTQHLKIEVEQTAREVRWIPRVIETPPPPAQKAQSSIAIIRTSAPVAATRKARPAIKPIEDNKPYEMPEDINAFNAFWERAEQRLRRRLKYEDVVVSYNRYRHGISVKDHEE